MRDSGAHPLSGSSERGPDSPTPAVVSSRVTEKDRLYDSLFRSNRVCLPGGRPSGPVLSLDAVLELAEVAHSRPTPPTPDPLHPLHPLTGTRGTCQARTETRNRKGRGRGRRSPRPAPSPSRRPSPRPRDVPGPRRPPRRSLRCPPGPLSPPVSIGLGPGLEGRPPSGPTGLPPLTGPTHPCRGPGTGVTRTSLVPLEPPSTTEGQHRPSPIRSPTTDPAPSDPQVRRSTGDTDRPDLRYHSTRLPDGSRLNRHRTETWGVSTSGSTGGTRPSTASTSLSPSLRNSSAGSGSISSGGGTVLHEGVVGLG